MRINKSKYNILQIHCFLKCNKINKNIFQFMNIYEYKREIEISEADFIDIRLKIISINDISITKVMHTWNYM